MKVAGNFEEHAKVQASSTRADFAWYVNPKKEKVVGAPMSRSAKSVLRFGF